jgi:hypothetical protein
MDNSYAATTVQHTLPAPSPQSCCSRTAGRWGLQSNSRLDASSAHQHEAGCGSSRPLYPHRRNVDGWLCTPLRAAVHNMLTRFGTRNLTL